MDEKYGFYKDGIFHVPKNGKLRVGSHDIDFNVIHKGKISLTSYDFSKYYYEAGYTKSHTRLIRKGKLVKFNTYTYDISKANIHEIK